MKHALSMTPNLVRVWVDETIDVYIDPESEKVEISFRGVDVTKHYTKRELKELRTLATQTINRKGRPA